MGHVEDRWFVIRDGQKVPSVRHGHGRRWRVRYVADGRERSEAFERKIDAERKLSEVRADLLRGQWVDPTNRTTVAEYARQWAATRPHSEGTAGRVTSMFANHLEATDLGGRRLGSVRPSEAQAWVTGRSQVLAPTTLRLLVGLVRSVFTAAVLDHLVAASPFARVTLPRHDQERIVPLTVEQVRSLSDVMASRYRAMVLAQAGLGLRVGELLALRVDDVDFLRRTVRIEHQVDQKTRELRAPKTPQSRRVLPLPGMVSDALAAHLAAHPAGAGIGCVCASGATCSRVASPLLFHTATDRPLWSEHFGTRVFARAVDKAKLPAGTTSHDLRHHYASVLLAAGESVVAVAERLGHEDATLVLTTYGHLMADREDHTRRAIDAAWTTVSGAPKKAVTAQGRPR